MPIFQIANWLGNLEQSLVGWVIYFHPWELALMVCSLVATWIYGMRLGKFSKPGYARWSLFVRDAATIILAWPSGILLAGITFFLGVVASLAFFLDWQLTVWEVVKSHFLGFVIGLLAGGIAGGFGYYWWIPGLEQPRGTGIHEQIPRVHDRYDPEEYFRG